MCYSPSSMLSNLVQLIGGVWAWRPGGWESRLGWEGWHRTERKERELDIKIKHG